jgi:hypothetical protein
VEPNHPGGRLQVPQQGWYRHDAGGQRHADARRERAGNETNEPAVIAEWSPIIPAVACNFPNRDGTVTTLVGSGMLVRGASGALGVVASAAVLSPEGKVADACYVTFQDGPSYTILSADIHADPQLTLTGVSAIQLEDNQC